MNLNRKILIATTLLLSPALAFAHPGHDHAGVMSGLAHPLFGLDHLLAMLAVGLWAAQQQGAARWALPLTFVATMLFGGLLGFAGIEMPLMETGIAGSVLALGLLVALAVRPPVAIAAGLTALFAASHGVAHGLELPALSSPGVMPPASSLPPPPCMRQAMPWHAACRRPPHRWYASPASPLP